MKKLFNIVLALLFCITFLGSVNAEELKPSTPVLSGNINSYESGQYTYVIEINIGDYTIGEEEYSIDGFELYLKSGNCMDDDSCEILSNIDVRESVDDAQVIEFGEERTIVARVYKLNESNEKVYSDYSNVIEISATSVQTPVLSNEYSKEKVPFVGYESGKYLYDIGINQKDYEISEGMYLADGYELYLKSGNCMADNSCTLVNSGDENYSVDRVASVNLNHDEVKTYVARAYIIYNDERKYSTYSNELVISAPKLDAPILNNEYAKEKVPFTGYENGKYIYDISINRLDYYYDEVEGKNVYFADGYVICEKGKDLCINHEMEEVAGIQVLPGETKTLISKVYLQDENGDRTYSSESKEFVIENKYLALEKIVENFNNSDMVKLFNEFGTNITAKIVDDNIVITLSNEEENESIEVKFGFDGDNIYYQDLETKVTKETVENNLVVDLCIMQIMNSVFDITGYSNYSLKDEVEIDKDNSFDKYGIMLTGEEYEFKEETEEGTSTLSGTFVRNFKISVNKTVIDKLMEEYGEDNSIPSGLAPVTTVSDITKDSVSISAFVKDANDKDYTCYIYRSTNRDGEYELVSNFAINCTEEGIIITDEGLKPNTTYYYKSMILDGDTYSDVVEVKTKYATDEVEISPVIKVSKGNNNSLVISWDKVEKASGYKIYRSESKNGKYKQIATTGEATFTNTGLTYGKTYYYKVTAFNNLNSKTSNIVSKKVVPNKVENLTFISAGTNNVKISWNKVNVTGYEIYRSTNNKSWTKVTTITKAKTLTFNNTRLKANTTYYYKVRAYKTVSGKKIYGAYSDVITTKTAPASPKISISNKNYNSLNITVKKVSGASKYNIYRSTKRNGTYTKVGQLSTAGIYTDTELTTGKTYYYKVKACNSNDKCSGYSSIVYKKVVPSKPSFTATIEEKNINLEVKAIEGSTGYEVYRSTRKNSGYKKVITLTNDLTYTETLKKGTYYYKVRTYVTVNGKKVYSSYSAIKSIKVK